MSDDPVKFGTGVPDGWFGIDYKKTVAWNKDMESFNVIKLDNICDYCRENFTAGVTYQLNRQNGNSFFSFKNEEDAVAFCVKWC